jgi:adenylate cyclase class 2
LRCSGSGRPLALEQEVKLAFPTIEAARQAITIAGGRLVASRRLIADQLFDRETQPLRATGCTLRIRRDGTRGILTFKGAPQQGTVKIREEIETEVGSVAALEAIASGLGFSVFFSAQKWREEYRVELDGQSATIALDDTPIGVYVEIEADAEIIGSVTLAMGRTPAEWILSSYQRLFTTWAITRGLPTAAMRFGDPS